MNTSQTRLLDLVPPIRRARGYRLYTADGRRLVDLWQYNGAALLGHTAPRVLTVLKDTASRGLFFPVPHPGSRRLQRSLERLFPGRGIRVYADSGAADAALRAGGYAVSLRDFADPGRGVVGADCGTALWRPWCDNVVTPVLAPVLPLPWQNGPAVLVLAPDVADGFPPSDYLSPLVLATAARAVDDLLALPAEGRAGQYRRLDAAVAASAWERRGIYLHLREELDEEGYTALFSAFLRAGFLLPPDPRGLLILPGELSAGEEAHLTGALSIPPQAAIL